MEWTFPFYLPRTFICIDVQSNFVNELEGVDLDELMIIYYSGRNPEATFPSCGSSIASECSGEIE